jgi:gliding motility-associated-like protein
VYKKVYLNILPTPQIDVPENFTICKGATVTLTANAIFPITWDGYPQGATIDVMPEETTEYIARVVNELNCEGNASVTVYVEHFTLSLSASTTEAEIGIPVELTVTGNQNFQVTSWQPESLFPNQHIKQQSITFHEKGTAYITVTGETESNCRDTVTLSINILQSPSVFIPSAFTPNGDGMNDYFRPQFIRDYDIRNFSIFNRWGQKVYGIYTKQQLGNGWDGSFNGKKCDVGTYYYILSLQDPLKKESVIKGDVTLAN